VYGHGWIGASRRRAVRDPCGGQRGSPVRKSHVPRLSVKSRLIHGWQQLPPPRRAGFRWTGPPGMSCPRCVPLDWIAIPSQVVTRQLRTRPYRRGLMRCQQVGPAGSYAGSTAPSWPLFGPAPEPFQYSTVRSPDTTRASRKNLMLTCLAE
jgi:hypothetical protein